MKTRLLIIYCVVLVLAGCNQPPLILESERKDSWTKNDNFLNTRSLINNAVNEQSNLYVLGYNRLSIVEGTLDNTFDHFLLSNENPVHNRLPLTADLFPSLTSTHDISYQYTALPQEPQSRITLDLLALDNSFARFDFPAFNEGDAMLLNSNGSALVPYLVFDGNNTISFTPHLYLFKLELTGSGAIKVPDTTLSKRFVLGTADGAMESLNSVNDQLFVTCTNATYKLSGNDQLEKVSTEQLKRIFQLNNSLIGISESMLYSSSDNGQTWTTKYPVSPDFARLRYADVNGILIGFDNSEIYEIELDNTSIIARELVNDGIAGNEIMTVCYFGNQVIVSTLSGLFSRAFDEFLDYE